MAEKPKAVKVDNGNLLAKLELRRHFIRRFHADGEPIRVFDCCQGSGVIWSQLRQEFAIESYWGVDIKPQRGRIKIDSEQVLIQSGMRENVIDIDTYGSPWRHWQALLSNLNRSVTVFLTIGHRSIHGKNPSPMNLSDLDLRTLGIPPAFRAECGGGTLALLTRNAYELLDKIALSRANNKAVITYCVEACNDKLTRYVGVRLEIKTPAVELPTPQRAEQVQPLKEAERV